MKYRLGCFLLIVMSSLVTAQQGRVHGFFETGVLAGTKGRIPFWMLANQYGRFSPESANGYIDAGLFSDSLKSEKKFDWDWGLEGFGRYDGSWDGWLHQGYVGGKAGWLYLYAGWKEEHFGIQDPELSSGFVIWSGNARPVPQISLSTPGYIPVPFTKGFAEVKGGISHGWFGDDGYVKGAMLHHKYIYLRVGGSSRLHLNAGLHHFVQWGGTSPVYGKLPSGFRDFLKVFVACAGKDSVPGVPTNEWENRFGNHLGTKDFSVDYTFNNDWMARIYWQNFIEDITGLGFRNIEDGLWGITVSKGRTFELCYEFINTTTGNKRLIKGCITGIDDYFNNSIYSSWTYHDYTIGTPFITSPLLRKDRDAITNNRVTVHYGAIKYRLPAVDFIVKYSRSKNLGASTNLYDPPLIQNSLLVAVHKEAFPIKGMDMKAGMALDCGKLYGDHCGFSVGLRVKL